MGVHEQRVLVVDDNAQNRALAQATLEDDGYQVTLASGGVEALEAYARVQPDCILLDIQMPDLDGIAVCERIRALPGGGEVAIVFVTAQREIATFDRALAVGGDDFLTKPFRPSELVVRVQTAMRLRRLAGERSELFAEVKRQRDDLQRLQLQKEQLTAFLIHDFKNPVNSIELQAERLLRDPAGSERTRSASTAIRSEARSLMRMILDLLDLSRADEGRLPVVPAEVEVAPFLDAVAEELRPMASKCAVTLAVSGKVERPLWADATLARRVLANLVENAIRHAPEDSGVELVATQSARGTEVRVIDHGTGVPAELREHVFERFTTGGGSHNRGLGLAFCKVALAAHGGEIWIEDAAPGAIFCVRFPDDGR